ncbi:MAG: hypothetical protein WKF67_11795, partial [Rubrobacteraceae bacterium]
GLYGILTGRGQSILDELVGESIFPEMVDLTLDEWVRLNTSSETSWGTDLFNTITGAAQKIYDYVVGKSTFPALVNETTSWWQTLNENSETEWGTNLYKTITQAALDIYNYVVGESTFPALVDESVDEWGRLNSESVSPWQSLVKGISDAAGVLKTNVLTAFGNMVTEGVKLWEKLKTGAITAMQGAKKALLDRSPVPDIANGVLEYFGWMKDGTVEITEDTTTALMRMWNALPDDMKWALEETAYQIQDTLGVAMFEDLSMTTQQGMEDFQNNVATGAEDITSPILDAFNALPMEARHELDALGQAIADHYGMEVSEAEDFANEYSGTILDAFNALPVEARNELGTLGQAIAEEFGLMVSGADESGQQLANAAFDPLTLAAQQIPGQFDAMGNRINQSMQGIGQGIGTAVSGIQENTQTGFQNASQFAIDELKNIMSAVQKLMGFMGIQGSMSSGSSGTPRAGMSQAAPARARAKGGIDKNSEPQGPTGGISSGIAPRIVYGEQARNVKEAYIVEDRPDNLPYLAEAASWYGLGLSPVEGMAKGGVRRGKGIGLRYGQVAKLGGGKKKKDKPDPKERKSQRKAVTGRSGGRPGYSTSPSGTSGSANNTKSQSDSTGSVSQTESVDSSGTSGSAIPTSGGTPTCGVYPVASPTGAEQQPYTDAALGTYGLTPVPASPATGYDHVNAPADSATIGDLCGAGASGSPVTTPYPSIGLMPSGASPTPTTSYDPCAPSFTMAAGGVLPGGTGAARPLEYTTAPIGTWGDFLGMSWYGDPTMDWPEIVPPSGWDPTQVYGDPMAAPNGSTTGMAQGGVLRNGTRYFQAGGLNQAQIDAGIAAGNSALGAFYSYGSAGEDGGWDCAGIWNYIESAVAYGSPQTGKRWGTYAAAEGGGGAFSTPGAVPGGVNIGVDLSGWGGPDDTHMAGDIGGIAFESDGYNGVYNGYDSSAFGTQYTMGGSDYTEMLPASPSYTPAPTVMQEVADWWNCAAAPLADQAALGPAQAVNPWDSALPGMTQDYLTDVGMGTLGSLGGATAPTGNSLQDWIVAALNASGMDASPEAIATL